MITKSSREIKILREGGSRLAEILDKVVQEVKPGISTLELDGLAEGLIFEYGGEPSFKGYKPPGASTPYLGSLCVSVNEEVVHSIPRRNKILDEGDVVSLDIGMKWPASAKATAGEAPGLYTDMAITLGVGPISHKAEQLISITKEALDEGIKAVRPGANIGDIGHAVEKHLKKYHLGIIKILAGHGVGRAVHEEPLIPNYGRRGAGPEIKEGMVLAIEPMATLGGEEVALASDGWTFRTKDKSLAAHFEHTILVTPNGAELLTRKII